MPSTLVAGQQPADTMASTSGGRSLGTFQRFLDSAPSRWHRGSHSEAQSRPSPDPRERSPSLSTQVSAGLVARAVQRATGPALWTRCTHSLLRFHRPQPRDGFPAARSGAPHFSVIHGRDGVARGIGLGTSGCRPLPSPSYSHTALLGPRPRHRFVVRSPARKAWRGSGLCARDGTRPSPVWRRSCGSL